MTSCPEIWGGSEELWGGAAERMAAAGMRVVVARSHKVERDHPRYQRMLSAGILVESFQHTIAARLGMYLWRRFHSAVPLLRRFGPWIPHMAKLQSWKPALALISQGGTYDAVTDSPNLVSICEAADIPYALVCQKSSDITWPSDRNRTYLQAIFERALQVFFVSQHNLTLTEQQLGRTLTNAQVVRNPFMVRTRTPFPWPAPRDGVLRLACVARMWIRDKGQDLLLTVLASEKWRRRRIEVDFFGTGDNARALEEMATLLGLERVRFRGFTNDVEQVWREHHALVLPSRAEGLPLVLVEAMICGRIGIVTATGGSAEVVTDGVTGFLARHPTVESLDETLERAWQQAEHWEAMGREASRSIWEHYPEDPCEVFAGKVTALREQVLGLARQRPRRGEIAPRAGEGDERHTEVERQKAL